MNSLASTVSYFLLIGYIQLVIPIAYLSSSYTAYFSLNSQVFFISSNKISVVSCCLVEFYFIFESNNYLFCFSYYNGSMTVSLMFKCCNNCSIIQNNSVRYDAWKLHGPKVHNATIQARGRSIASYFKFYCTHSVWFIVCNLWYTYHFNFQNSLVIQDNSKLNNAS